MAFRLAKYGSQLLVFFGGFCIILLVRLTSPTILDLVESLSVPPYDSMISLRSSFITSESTKMNIFDDEEKSINIFDYSTGSTIRHSARHFVD